MNNKINLLKRRPRTASSKYISKDHDPFHPYSILPEDKILSKINSLDKLNNPAQILSKFYNSFNFEKSAINAYTQKLENANKRGLRCEDTFNKFINFMQKNRIKADDNLIQTKNILHELEKKNNFNNIEKKDKVFKDKQDTINLKMKSQFLEKKIKNLTEKMNNKISLIHINKVLDEIYEEKKRAKKLLKYTNSPKKTKNKLLFSFEKSKSIKNINNSNENDEKSDYILENNDENSFIPLAVKKALSQLKNFMIDTNLDSEKYGEEIYQNRILSPKKELKRESSFNYNSIIQNKNYKNEKHLKTDFKMFKGKIGNKLIRKFTVGAEEEAHNQEMNYYLNLIRLKNVNLPKNDKNTDIYTFNNDLRKIYAKETLIRSHGKGFKRKFDDIKKDINGIKDKYYNINRDKLEIKIHKQLMKDYKADERKKINELVEKMKPIPYIHKNSL